MTSPPLHGVVVPVDTPAGDARIRTAGTWAICLFILLAAVVAGYAYLAQEDAIAVALLGAALVGVGTLFVTDRI